MDLQVELLQLQRRVQSRVSLPAIRLDKDYLNGLLATPPVLQVRAHSDRVGDLRFLLRATAAAMRSHEALDEADFRRVETLCRDSERLPAALRSWYDSTKPSAAPISDDAAGLEPVILQAMRPVPDALGRRDHGQDRSRRLDRRHLSALRRRAGLRRDHAGSRSDPHLRALFGALALPPDHLPVLRQCRQEPDDVVREPGRTVPALRVRCV